jgi:hypothetical protein
MSSSISFDRRMLFAFEIFLIQAGNKATNTINSYFLQFNMTFPTLPFKNTSATLVMIFLFI